MLKKSGKEHLRATYNSGRPFILNEKTNMRKNWTRHSSQDKFQAGKFRSVEGMVKDSVVMTVNYSVEEQEGGVKAGEKLGKEGMSISHWW